MKRKTKHYIEEAIVFLFLIIAVIMADAVHKIIKGQIINWVDLMINIPSLIVMIFIAISMYGGMYTRPYSEEAKVDPLPKKIANAVSQGFMWRLLLS